MVLGAFMSGNPADLAADGSGFEFVADCLIDIDKRNPQLAARMALPLTRMMRIVMHAKMRRAGTHANSGAINRFG